MNWEPLPRNQTTDLGQPRGPKIEMRMPPDEVVAAIAMQDSKRDGQTTCLPITTAWFCGHTENGRARLPPSP